MDKELGIYFNWSCNQLAFEDSVSVDHYLRLNLDTVKRVAARLLRYIDYKPEPLYRGVIMDEDGMTELWPHEGFTYLSFSESRAVAEIFADPKNEMAALLPEKFGTSELYGYVTYPYIPAVEQVLFHHKFLSLLPYVEAQRRVANVDCSRIHEQKEVTILQPATPLLLKPFKILNHANR